MPSLAQAIIDTAHNLSVKPTQTRYKFAESFFNATQEKIGASKVRQYTIDTAGMIQDIPLIAPIIKKALRYSIDQSVADAIVKMSNTPRETLIKALKFAEPPHDPTWIEFPLPDDHLKAGWLVEKHKDGLLIHHVTSTSTMNHMPIYHKETCSMIVTPEGYKHSDTNKKVGSLLGQSAIEKQGDYICGSGLIILLLLNSRSRVLKTNPPTDDLTRLNKARLRSGKEEIPLMNTITFDVARAVRNGEKSDIEAAREMAAALVRGHFKVRQTGVFFWSPYVRNARDDEHRQEVYAREISSERRDTICTGPTMLPQPL